MENQQVNFLTAKRGGITFTAMILLNVFVTFIVQIIVGKITGFSGVTYIAVVSSVSSLIMIGFAIYYSVRYKGNLLKITRTNKFNPLYIFVVIVLFFGMFCGLGFLNGSIAKVAQDFGLNVSVMELPMENAGHLALFIIVLGLLPAIAEEWFFRGIMLECVKGASVIQKILIVGTSFALYHGNIVQQAYQVIYGGLLTLLAIKSGSSIPCMIVHFLNNATVIVIEYFKVHINLNNPLLICSGVLMLICGALLLLITFKIKVKEQRVFGEAVRFYLPYGLMGFIICTAMIVVNLI